MTPPPAIISPTNSPYQSVDDTIIPETATSSEIVEHCNSPGTILRIARHQRETRELEFAIGVCNIYSKLFLHSCMYVISFLGTQF